MKLGLIGLGKMGFPLAEHLYEDKHEVVVYDVNKELVEKADKLGITARHSLKEMIAELEAPRTIWVMVPAGEVVESVLKEVYPLLEKAISLLKARIHSIKIRYAVLKKRKALVYIT